MSEIEDLANVFKAEDLILLSTKGIKSLSCLVWEMPDDSSIKKILCEEDDLFGKLESFQEFLSYDKVKEDKLRRMHLIQTFSAFLRIILARMNSLPAEKINTQQPILLEEMFPKTDLNLVFNIISSTLVLAVFNLEKASELIERDLEIEVKFKNREETD